jgi:hypothetical protein
VSVSLDLPHQYLVYTLSCCFRIINLLSFSLVSLSLSLSLLHTGRALQRAAAAAAVERARRARMAQGVAAKGGGKGKGAEEREEECSICQSEFTVRGDGGECFFVII